MVKIELHIFCPIPRVGRRELPRWDYGNNTRGESSWGERGEEKDRCLVARKMVPRFFSKDEWFLCWREKKWERDNLASLRHMFLVIPMPIQQEIFICPAEDRNLSEVVILVTNEAFLHGNEYVHAVACTVRTILWSVRHTGSPKSPPVSSTNWKHATAPSYKSEGPLSKWW